MYIIRRSKVEDISIFLKLAKMVNFINLPPSREIITEKIVHSRRSFIRAADPKVVQLKNTTDAIKNHGITGLGDSTERSDLFMFSLEDLESESTLGTSQLLARMGGPGNPNVSFQLIKKKYYSQSLQWGTTHTVAKMFEDETGPTEIGGLILQPSYRGHPLKLGRLLSMVRFHFIGLRRQLFADRMLAEMMAPLTSDGHNHVWDYLGRRFIHLSYEEADRFCQISREFMTSLLPKEEIQLALLPPKARAGIGQVSKETVPALKMLEKLGFMNRDYIDPFDGGPHLDCPTDDVVTVKQTFTARVHDTIAKAKCKGHGIVSTLDSDGEFLAVETPYHLDTKKRVLLPRDAVHNINADNIRIVGITPLTPPKRTSTINKSGKISKKAVKKPTKKTTRRKAP